MRIDPNAQETARGSPASRRPMLQARRSKLSHRRSRATALLKLLDQLRIYINVQRLEEY